MSGVRGGAGWYSPGAPSVLTQIVPYSSSYYTVFHSVIFNSVEKTKPIILTCGNSNAVDHNELEIYANIKLFVV